MTTFPARAAWPACLSALALDRWTAGELSPGEAEGVRAHVAGCGSCREAVEALRPPDAALPPLRAAAAPRGARLRGPLALGAALAAAASIAVFLRTEAPGERAKGAGGRVGMYVLHEGVVRRAAPGEEVAPGDSVRFTVTSAAAAWVAVVSVDPAGRAQVYFPEGARAAPVAAGVDVPLPLATRLDATRGEERVLGLLCDRAVELEPIRAGLEAGSEQAVPAGCEATRWSFVKR